MTETIMLCKNIRKAFHMQYDNHPIIHLSSEFYRMEKDKNKPNKYSETELRQAKVFWDCWNHGVRTWLFEQGKYGLVGIDDIHDGYVEGFDVTNIFSDADIALLNSGMHEERISVCMDLLAFFDWTGNSRMESALKGYIGESINGMGKCDVCDQFFEKLLKEEPDNLQFVGYYISCLQDRGTKEAFEKAKELFEAHVDTQEEITDTNEALFESAEYTYLGLGEETRAKYVRYRIDEWQASQPDGITISPLNSDSALFLKENPDAFADIADYVDMDATARDIPRWRMEDGQIVSRSFRRIYPNDPCPCGSGKKYKNCCGADNEC